MRKVNGYLPAQVTDLIGRRDVQQTVRRALRRARLVTLTGFGGIGKTRIALAAGKDLIGDYPDGVWFVDLAPVRSSSRPEEAILRILSRGQFSNVHPRDALVERVHDKNALIILDNWKHLSRQVLETAAAVLEAAPEVRILTTSRESLDGSGERVIEVPPLVSPDPDGPLEAKDLSQFDAVRLLVERTTAYLPSFEVTNANARPIARLCAELGGNPLAIELAASRLRSISVGQLVDRLADQFATLDRGDHTAPTRQQSLRKLVSWSWDLCTTAEQYVWTHCSVFAEKFSLEAAEYVCGGRLSTDSVLETLHSLISKSVLQVEMTAHTTRYRFLETLKQYGESRLNGSLEEARRRHRDYFAILARRALTAWAGPRQSESISVIRSEHNDIRKALEWSFSTTGEHMPGVQIVNDLRFHWAVGGHLVEGSHWLEQSLSSNQENLRERGSSLWIAAWVALVSGDREKSQSYVEQCAELSRATGDIVNHAYSHAIRGCAALFSGDLKASSIDLKYALDSLVAVHETGGYLLHAMQYVICLAQLEQFDEANEVGQRALRVSEDLGELWGRSQAHWALGYTAWRQGDAETAERLVRESLKVRLHFNRVGTALDLETLAWIALSKGDPTRAVRLLAVTDRMWEQLQTGVDAFGVGFGKHTSDTLESLKGGPFSGDIQARRKESLSWSEDEVLSYALTGDLPAEAEATAPEPVRLTRRESEVAHLVAEGLSNREIADELTLSPRTVEGHVENVLVKFGFRSRVQIASWIGKGLHKQD